MIVAAPHLGFWGVPGISNTPRIISPLESPQNGTQPGSLLEVFPTLRTSPYFFHVPFIAIQRTLVGHSGNEWEMFGFHSFLTILASFWASLVIVAATHFEFWGVPGISISPLGKAHKIDTFLTLCASPYFFHIPFIAIQRTLGRKHRERKVVRWTLVVLASTLQKKGWHQLPKLLDASNNCNWHFLQKAFRQTPSS